MVFIYVLLLELGKYYIGKTTNPFFRLELHFNSGGSEWTKKYKPLKLIEIIPNCDDYDEDKYTRIYMDKYGINNVRGGSFVSIELDKPIMDTLKQMNNGTNDNCFVCGRNGHFAKDCENNKYLQDFDTIEKVETEILQIINLMNTLKRFNSNKYIEIPNQKSNKYIELPNQKIEINPELYSNAIAMINDTPMIYYRINTIFSAYASEKQINTIISTSYNSNDKNIEFLKLKINFIYIERRKQEIQYYESLPSEYAEIFKKNNYENIFELVKDKLFLKLELLYEKQADFISKW